MKREEIKLGMILKGRGEPFGKFPLGERFKVIGVYLEGEGITSICKVRNVTRKGATSGKYVLPNELNDLVEFKELRLYAYKGKSTQQIKFFEENDRAQNGFIRIPKLDLFYY